jgi:hypothetical protein
MSLPLQSLKVSTSSPRAYDQLATRELSDRHGVAEWEKMKTVLYIAAETSETCLHQFPFSNYSTST